MEKESTQLEEIPVPKFNQTDKVPTVWKWYFGWHPRIFLTVPTFLIFVIYGLWYIWFEFQDVIYFFQTKPVTWGAILLILILGSLLIWFLIAPIYISFMSISWLYQINIGNYTAWKKFLYSTGILLLVIFGTGIIRLFTDWVLRIL